MRVTIVGPERPQRVLVVDDHEDAAEQLSTSLRRADHDVAVTPDRPQAPSVASRRHPSVAVLDLGLPVMDGCELAAQLRARLAGDLPRFVASTDYGEASERARTCAAGFDHPLVKQVNREDSLRTLDAVGRSRGA